MQPLYPLDPQAISFSQNPRTSIIEGHTEIKDPSQSQAFNHNQALNANNKNGSMSKIN
jgi:hypothetical protein